MSARAPLPFSFAPLMKPLSAELATIRSCSSPHSGLLIDVFLALLNRSEKFLGLDRGLMYGSEWLFIIVSIFFVGMDLDF